MADEKDKGNIGQELIQQALTYAQGTNGLENHILTIEELNQIQRDVTAGKGDKSFLMAVLEYIRNKKEQQVLVGDEHGRAKK